MSRSLTSALPSGRKASPQGACRPLGDDRGAPSAAGAGARRSAPGGGSARAGAAGRRCGRGRRVPCGGGGGEREGQQHGQRGGRGTGARSCPGLTPRAGPAVRRWGEREQPAHVGAAERGQRAGAGRRAEQPHRCAPGHVDALHLRPRHRPPAQPVADLEPASSATTRARSTQTAAARGSRSSHSSSDEDVASGSAPNSRTRTGMQRDLLGAEPHDAPQTTMLARTVGHPPVEPVRAAARRAGRGGRPRGEPS